MKIIHEANECNVLYLRTKFALEECLKCPHCGTGIEHSDTSVNLTGKERRKAYKDWKKFSGIKLNKDNFYKEILHCPICGCGWESEPYYKVADLTKRSIYSHYNTYKGYKVIYDTNRDKEVKN